MLLQGDPEGYRLAKERRKIRILDIIKSVSETESTIDLYKSNLSRLIIEPLINEFLNDSMIYFNKITIEDIYNKFKKI